MISSSTPSTSSRGIAPRHDQLHVRGLEGMNAVYPVKDGQPLEPDMPISRRRSASRCDASDPWQAKQFSARIGRICSLNVTGSAAPAHAPTCDLWTRWLSWQIRRDTAAAPLCELQLGPFSRAEFTETIPERDLRGRWRE